MPVGRSIPAILFFALIFAGWQGALPAQAQHATPTPAPAPRQPEWRSIDLGVPQGNAYSPLSISVDEVNGLAYVYNAHVPAADGQTNGAVTVVDITDGSIVRRTVLALNDRTGGLARLAVTRNGQRGYLLDGETDALYIYDPRIDQIDLALQNVRAFFLSPDEQHVVVQHAASMAVYTPDLRTRQWQVFNNAQQIAVGNAGILVERWDETGEYLTLYRLENEIPLAQIDKPNWVEDLAAGPDGHWFVAANPETPVIWLLDDELNLRAETPGLATNSLFYDAHRNRLLVSGYHYDAGQSSEPAAYTLRALNAEDLSVEVERRWDDGFLPDRFAATDETLIGIREYDEHDRLHILDGQTLETIHTVALGIRLNQIVADGEHERLFVADNQNRIHRIDLVSGESTDVWTGTPPLALDAAHNRLYVNRWEAGKPQVVALDADGGDVVVRFPQGGQPSPDPQRDRVYITDQGVTVYNRNGDLLGRLPRTFPDESPFVPNPYAFKAVVNPVTGSLLVFENNGVPGSNNRNSASVYPPPISDGTMPAGEPLPVPNLDNVLALVDFNRKNGDIFLTYNSFGGSTGVQRLRADGTPLDQVNGRTGFLHYHTPSRSLYVQQADVLAQFNQSLELADLWLAPTDLDLTALDDATGQFYYQVTWQGPVIVHLALDRLARLTWTDGAAYALDELPAEKTVGLVVAEQVGEAPMLFVSQSGHDLFQSNDGGGHWRQLYLGTQGGSDLISAAADGTLYFTNHGSQGGDGVFYSEDGGDSWAMMNEGLTDLRGAEPIHSVDPDRLYLVTAQQRLLVWDRAQGHWAERPIPEDIYLGSERLKLAPDGTLFLAGSQTLYRSDDGGARWQQISTAQPPIEDWQFDPDFVRTERIYGIADNSTRRVVRSDDGGESWLPTTPGITLDSGYPYHWVELLLGNDALFIVEHDLEYLRMLYRSTDAGEHWEQLADADLLIGAEAPAVLGKGNVLWFVRDRTAAQFDLDSLAWMPFTPQPRPAPSPTPTPGATGALPSPTATPAATPLPLAPASPTPATCELRLDNEETRVREQVPALACPLDEPFSTSLARQPFEQGMMIWRKDTGSIYVLTQDGRWQEFADTWDESQPLSDPDLAPPLDLHQPVRGFGQVWREQLGGPDATIGWATATESGEDGQVQPWDGGTLITLLPHEGYALLTGGTWQRVE